MVTPLALSSMGRLGALSHNNTDPEHASRPFDANRDGFVLGEGAGILLLETEESALERGARVYGELAGVGWSFDATDDAAPDAGGQALAMLRALRDGGVDPTEVDYLNAHGTSTPYNDRTETQAIKLALGEAHARRIAMSSQVDDGHRGRRRRRMRRSTYYHAPRLIRPRSITSRQTRATSMWSQRGAARRPARRDVEFIRPRRQNASAVFRRFESQGAWLRRNPRRNSRTIFGVSQHGGDRQAWRRGHGVFHDELRLDARSSGLRLL
jgi:hypothetical protein